MLKKCDVTHSLAELIEFESGSLPLAPPMLTNESAG
jgi:hypothetical protein